MARLRNTNARGGSWTAEQLLAVWQKGRVIDGYDPAVWRYDACGKPMQRSQHGNDTDYGWEVDHIKPVAHGGGDEVSNLQPLHWKNNRHKGDSWPNWSCAA